MSPEQLLGSVDTGHVVLVSDLEAGLGTLTRLGEGVVDAVLIVVEPTAKSLEVGARAAELAQSKGVGRVIVVANRVRDDADVSAVRRALGDDVEMVVVPDDPAITAAERRGVAPLDVAPDAPAVRALAGLAARIRPPAA